MKKQYLPYLQLALILIVLLLPMLSTAQQLFIDPPNGNPFNSGSNDPDVAPIDGGLSLLVAAGVGYGAKKMKERKEDTTKIRAVGIF